MAVWFSSWSWEAHFQGTQIARSNSEKKWNKKIGGVKINWSVIIVWRFSSSSVWKIAAFLESLGEIGPGKAFWAEPQTLAQTLAQTLFDVRANTDNSKTSRRLNFRGLGFENDLSKYLLIEMNLLQDISFIHIRCTGGRLGSSAPLGPRWSDNAQQGSNVHKPAPFKFQHPAGLK